MKSYDYHHIVGFDETNLVGNVYFSSHIRWQGRCREMFLRQYAREILDEFSKGVALVTTKVSCEYFAEVCAFDEIVVRMRLAGRTLNKLTMAFEYWRVGPAHELVARGEQEIACVRRVGSEVVAIPPPAVLIEALRPYADELNHSFT